MLWEAVMKGEIIDKKMISPIITEIKSVLSKARENITYQVNGELLQAYWNIGRIIVEYEQSQPERADYGKQTIRELSKALTRELGRGFSVFESI